MSPLVTRLVEALIAIAFGLYFASALMRGKAVLPQRFGPIIIADRRTKPASFWTAVVVSGVVAAFSALIAIVGSVKPPAGVQLVGLGGDCLGVRAGGRADGTPVELRVCVPYVNGAYQFWTVANGQIVSVSSGKCLELGDSGGAPIDIRTCAAGPNQQWAFQGGAIVGPGGKCLSAQDGAAEVKPVDLEPCANQPYQAWQAQRPQ